jgi:sugar lactone lactonase YvrE
MDEQLTEILESDKAELLVGGGDSEGPVWHPEGFLTFVRHHRSELVRWDPSGQVTILRDDTGNGNGCTLDLDGAVIMCEGDNRQVTRMAADGAITVIASTLDGKRLNRPNDVICRSDGSLYFTDPEARVPVEEREMGFAGVFRITPGGELQVATDECEYPNGLAFSPDESLLYVAISRRDERCLDEVKRGEPCPHRSIRVFDVAPDGSLSNHRVFADMTHPDPGFPDGVKVDSEGRVYCTGAGGVWVFEADGTHLGTIELPEGPRNLAFDGASPSLLYIAAGESVYRMRTRVTGLVGPRP